MFEKLINQINRFRTNTFPPSKNDIDWRHLHVDRKLELLAKKIDGLSIEFDSKIDASSHLRLSRRFVSYYNGHRNSELNRLCDLYGSDKGEIRITGHPYPWPSHMFADFYEKQFGFCREHINNVFECGLGTNNPDLISNMTESGMPGASLRVWRDYFPNAHIFGADIDAHILFQEKRITTFHCDQTCPIAIEKMWSNLEKIEFDIMIDDGLHTFDAGMCLFENSFHKLKSYGIYIIEDVLPEDAPKFSEALTQRELNFEIISFYKAGVGLDQNSLVIIRK